MDVDTEKLVAEALKLSPEQRAELTERLLRSLDEDDADSLDPGDRERLHAAIARSEEQFRDGQAVPADEVLNRLRR